MVNMVQTLPAYPVTSIDAYIRGYANFQPYIKRWEWQVLEPTVSKVFSSYTYVGTGFYYSRRLRDVDVPGYWPGKKIAFRFGGEPYRKPVIWGSWLYFFTYDCLYNYQAWGVDRHEIEHYGTVKSFYRPLDPL